MITLIAGLARSAIFTYHWSESMGSRAESQREQELTAKMNLSEAVAAAERERDEARELLEAARVRLRILEGVPVGAGAVALGAAQAATTPYPGTGHQRPPWHVDRQSVESTGRQCLHLAITPNNQTEEGTCQ